VSYDIGIDDLHDIARGAALLGTGGGGDPHIGRLLAEEAIRKNGPVTVLDPSELAADDLVIPTGMMGAPTVSIERICNGTETVLALEAVQRRLGRTATATMPIECGGINSLLPVMTAAQTRLPIVDADGMGRAFPELQMETFSVYGISAGPLAVAGSHQDVVLIETEGGNAYYEWLARGLTIRLGGASYMAMYPMSGADVQRTAIPGTLSMCRDLGAALRVAREEHVDPFAALGEAVARTHYPHFQELFHGKVTDVLRRTERGFTVGEAVLTARDGSQLDLQFQNEFVTATREGRIVCMVPDLICVLDEETAEPITTEALRFGHRVRVVGIATPPIMRTPESLAVFGPRMFGIDHDFEPVEEIWALR
jgi:DUF917 family protein